MSDREVIVPLRAHGATRDALARPMRDLRISVMDRCNFRCPYCMPRETYHERYRFLGSHERLSFDEIVRLARLFVQQGVRKLRLTGGEPLVRRNVMGLVRSLGRHLETGALDGCLDGGGTEIGGRDFFETSTEGPDRRAGRVCEDD